MTPEQIRADERARIVAELRFLGECRREYFTGPEPTHIAEIEALGASQLMVWTESCAAKNLADYIGRERDPYGWLPSWRWDEWADLTGRRAAGSGRAEERPAEDCPNCTEAYACGACVWNAGPYTEDEIREAFEALGDETNQDDLMYRLHWSFPQRVDQTQEGDR